MRIKTGDTVTIISGSEKGKSGKVTAADPKNLTVTIDGLNVKTRHIKPSRTNPQGGIKKEPMPISISKVGITHPKSDKRATRVGFEISKDGAKKRIMKANGKDV